MAPKLYDEFRLQPQYWWSIDLSRTQGILYLQTATDNNSAATTWSV